MGLWTSTHQLTINGKRDGFTLEDLLECAHVGSISKRRALHVIDQVSIAVSRWSSYADDARLSSELMAQIAAAHRLSMLSGR